jgi:capsular exopolysaccharide synthesis family protein
VNLEDYLRVLRSHWLGVLVAIVLGGGAAWGWAQTQTPMYAASSAGFVTSGASGDAGQANLDDILSKSRAASYVVLAKDRETASLVIRKLHLTTSPSALVNQISVSQPVDTVIIQITAKSPSPQGARDLADAWVSALAQRVASVENDGKSQGSAMRIEVSESAALPSSPVSPNVPRDVALGLVLGALLGFGYALLRHTLDRRVRNATDVERQFDVPVVAAVPQMGGRADGIIADAAPGDVGHAFEAYRRLRTNISYMSVDNPPRAIVVTSPRQGDGKSTTAANLAAAIAQSGQQVTLVDADLRRPRVANMIGVDDSVGLTDVLASRLSLEEVLQRHPSIDGLQILTTGNKPPNPSELLGSQAMRGVIEKLSESGFVVIDAPPLLPVTDAAILAHSADGALLTLSTGKTLHHEVETALGHLANANARALGVVLNRVSRRNVCAGYYGYYSYDSYEEHRALGRLGSVFRRRERRTET